MQSYEIRSKLDQVDSELKVLGTQEHLTKGQKEHWDRLCRQRDKLSADLETLTQRQEDIKQAAIRQHGAYDPAQYRTVSDDQRVRINHGLAAALRSLEANSEHFTDAALDAQDKLLRSDVRGDYCREFEVHSRPEYASGFQKVIACGDPSVAALQMTDMERQAFADSFYARAQSEGLTTQGGFGIPVMIDPSIILVNQENENAFLRLARTEQINTNAWKGVSGAGMTWSFDAEGAEVSDDSVTLAQPTVSVFMARGFIPFSIEVGQDYPNFANEMARLLSAGYQDLLLSKLTSGSGTGEPKGILTALTAQTATETVVTTDGAFGQEDIYAVWKNLPPKYRQRAAWMMSASVMNKIRQFGASNVYHATTITLAEGSIENLFSRPVYDNAYMPDFTGTTGAANILVLGDWSNYLIAQRSGMTAELVPLLVGSNQRPTGQRGFFAYARVGGNVVGSTSVGSPSFQVLVNT
jgi:HK97 family phage major capsid protein